MARSSPFLNLLRERRSLASNKAWSVVVRVQARGFEVKFSSHPPAPAKQQEAQVSQTDFAQFLADDAEKNPEKLVPFTPAMLTHAKDLLEGVELN